MLSRAVVISIAASVVLVGASHAPAWAAEPGEAAERLKFMMDSAAVYDVFVEPQRTEELSLRTDPLLRWNNPVSDVKDGTVYIWTDSEGRPHAAAQVFLAAGSDTLWLHEFQSLSERTFTFQRGGRVVWSPREAGVQMVPLADVPQPAETAARRLTQMRSIARQFEASDDFEGKSRWQLRLMPKPLVRYEGSDSRIIDGALFAFAHGTDPEVLLLLEARETDTGPRWYYGLAPMTGYAVKAFRHDVEIWSKPHRQPPFDPRSPFFILEYRP